MLYEAEKRGWPQPGETKKHVRDPLRHQEGEPKNKGRATIKYKYYINTVVKLTTIKESKNAQRKNINSSMQSHVKTL